MKRTIDLVLSIVLMPVVVVVCSAIAVVHLLMESGSPFLVQTRVGRHERPFRLIKMRTMTPDTKDMATHEVSTASVTRLGLFLRRAKLDELPQIWNVLRGEMSFVGPRPGLPVQQELLEARRARQVYDVRPGITGLGQISGVDMSQPVKLATLDARYIAQQSLLLDVQLALRTLLGYGFGDRLSSAVLAKHEKGTQLRADRLRVLFIITRADTLAGAQIHVLELATRLKSEGHDVHVLCGPGEALTRCFIAAGIGFDEVPLLQRQLNPLTDLRCIGQLTRRLAGFRPDLVSLHSSKAGILGRLACRRLGIPVIFTAHGWAFADGVGSLRRRLYGFIEQRLHTLANKIICVSEADRQLALERGFDSGRLITIHNGRHRQTERQVADRDATAPVRIAMVGRLDRQKDHPTLFAALQGLSNFELTLLGDGPREEALVSLADQENLTGKVRFMGLVSDVAAVLNESDVFVLISNWEGFPRSTLEAMRAGLPVIVSDVGGAAEAVIDGQTGFVVPRNDVRALRERLRLLIDDGNLRRELGVSGQQRFTDSFTFDRMYSGTLKVYADVLSGPELPERQPQVVNYS